MNTATLLDNIVPISVLNHGGASKTINNLTDERPAIIVKNNKPAAVLITPDEYKRLTEALENYELYILAEKRAQSEEKTLYTIDDAFGENYEPIDDGYEPEFE